MHLEISTDPSWQLTNLELEIGDRQAVAAPVVELDLQIPDMFAGKSETANVMGPHRQETQIAYGTVQVTPSVVHFDGLVTTMSSASTP